MFQQLAVSHHFARFLIRDPQSLFDIILHLAEETTPIGFFGNCFGLSCFTTAGLSGLTSVGYTLVFNGNTYIGACAQCWWCRRQVECCREMGEAVAATMLSGWGHSG